MKQAVQTSTTDGLMLDATVVLGLYLLRRMKSRATGIHILSAGPKLAFGQAAVNSA